MRLALFDSDHAICANIPGLLEYYAIVEATAEERATLAAAGVSTRAH